MDLNTYCPSVWNLFRVNLLVRIILKWLVDFWKICAPLSEILLFYEFLLEQMLVYYYYYYY